MVAPLLLLALLPTTQRHAARFGAPLPKGAALIHEAQDHDAYGQAVRLSIYLVPDPFEQVRRFYQRRFGRARSVRVVQSRESLHPDLIFDPRDPQTYMPVLRVLNLDYTKTWAAVFIRPIKHEALVAVLERKQPPEIAGARPPERKEIPRAVFEIGLMLPLKRPW